MAKPKNRPSHWQTAKRLMRVLLVVLPIAAGGFYLGSGGLERQPAPPPIMMGEAPVPLLEVRDAAGRVKPRTEDKATVRLDQGDSIRLRGGKLAQVNMETTDLPIGEAVEAYDRENRRLGWQLDPHLTGMVNELEKNSTLRVYVKRGNLRLVIIGPPQTPGLPARPVLVFEGQFRGSTAG